MIGRETVLGRLPAYKGNLQVYTMDQRTKDIVAAIMAVHLEEERNYDKICSLFDGATAEDIGENCFDFLTANSRYVAEDEDLQTVRSPSAIIATGKSKGLDCKNYASFTAGVIDALNRQGIDIPWCYRFAAYSRFGVPNKSLKHVFVVMYPDTEDEVWIDPVLSYFNSREKTPCYYQDENPHNMSLGKLSGIVNKKKMGDAYDDLAYYEGYTDDTESADPGFTFSSSALSAGSSTLPDLSSPSYFDPSTVQATAPDVLSYGVQPTDSGGYSFDYGDLSAPGSLIESGSNSPSFFDSLMNSVFGSKSSGATSGGGGGSAGGGGGSQQKPQQQQTPGATNIYVGSGSQAPGTTSSSNTLLIVGIAAAAAVGVYLLTRKK